MDAVVTVIIQVALGVMAYVIVISLVTFLVIAVQTFSTLDAMPVS